MQFHKFLRFFQSNCPTINDKFIFEKKILYLFLLAVNRNLSKGLIHYYYYYYSSIKTSITLKINYKRKTTLTLFIFKPYFASIKSFNEPTDFHALSVNGATHFSRLLSSSFDELSHKVVRSISNDGDVCTVSVVMLVCILWVSIHAMKRSKSYSIR